MRKEGETHEHEMTERKGRNEHESESVALLLPVGIEIKKRTEAFLLRLFIHCTYYHMAIL